MGADGSNSSAANKKPTKGGRPGGQYHLVGSGHQGRLSESGSIAGKAVVKGQGQAPASGRVSDTTTGQGAVAKNQGVVNRDQGSGRKRKPAANTVLTVGLASTARKTLLGL